MDQNAQNQELPRHKGGCHCGAVRFEVAAALPLALLDCNCSICRMTGFLHLIVPKADVRFEAGEDLLREYLFGTKTARHLFCPTCGVKPLYVPRSHPDCWSVNANCLEPALKAGAQITAFDGENWEESAARL